MNKLQLSILLNAVDKTTAPFRGVIGSVDRLSKAAQGSSKELKRLKMVDTEINRFKKLEAQTNLTAGALQEASAVWAKELGNQMAGEPATKKQVAALAKVRREVLRLQEAQQKQQLKLEESRGKLKQAGVSTHNLAEETRILEERTAAYNHTLEQQRQKLDRIGAMNTQLANVRRAAAGVGDSFGRVAREAGKLAILGGAAGWLFKRQFLDTAVEFERARTVLETVEGSSEKAGKSMEWVSDFAAKTPYQLGEVMDAFVKLRAYGLDPTNGLLRTLGDTAGAMDKPIIQAVEAIAAAITGENERLRQFGIQAKISGEEVTYTYTDKKGAQQEKTVDKNNRKEIQQTLEAIWNEKYAGAMEKRSRTWEGMLSNIGDQWTRFKNLVMDAGVFDWMKSRLEGLLSGINRLAETGKLKALAEEFGGNLKRGMEAAWKAGKAVWSLFSGLGGVLSWVASVLGGYERLGLLVAAMITGKMVIAVFSLVSSFLSLGKAVLAFEILSGASLGSYIAKMSLASVSAKLFTAEQWLLNIALSANPIGLVVAGVALLAGAAFLVIKYWEPVKAFFVGLWNYLKDIISLFLEVLGGPLAALIKGVGGLFSSGPEGETSTQGAGSTPEVNDVSRMMMTRIGQPVDFGKPLTAAGGGGGSVSINAPIQVYASPGMNSEDVANEVSRKLRERESMGQAQMRGRLYD
jgi:hypothetical protein